MRVKVEGELRGGWGGMCLESLVGFCRERMCMAFKMKMEGMKGNEEGLKLFLREAKMFGGFNP